MIDGSFFEKRVDRKVVLSYIIALRNGSYGFETQMPIISPPEARLRKALLENNSKDIVQLCESDEIMTT